VWPMPALQLYVTRDILDAVNRELAARPVYYRPTVNDGQIHLEGIAPDDTTRSAIQQALLERYPGVPVNTSAVLLADEVRVAVSTALADANIEGVTMQWQQPYLELYVDTLPAATQRTVHRVASELNHRYWGRLAVVGPDVLDQLPFAI